MTREQTAKLKTCPFCDEKAIIIKNEEGLYRT